MRTWPTTTRTVVHMVRAIFQYYQRSGNLQGRPASAAMTFTRRHHADRAQGDCRVGSTGQMTADFPRPASISASHLTVHARGGAASDCGLAWDWSEKVRLGRTCSWGSFTGNFTRDYVKHLALAAGGRINGRRGCERYASGWR